MYGADRQDRWKGAGAAALLVAVIGYGLIVGLDLRPTRLITDDLNIVALLPDAPPKKPDPVPAREPARKRKEGAASPPNLTAQATPVVAPLLVIPPPVPSPVIAATVAGQGSDPSQGAAPVIGPGTGSGGVGDGTGSGDGGDGDGDGGGETPLRLVSRKPRYKDLPRDLQDANAHGTVEMHFEVNATGHVTLCRVTRSSGDRDLDAATCALIRAKLRYRPTLDANGRPRADYVDGEQVWTAVRRPEDDPPD